MTKICIYYAYFNGKDTEEYFDPLRASVYLYPNKLSKILYALVALEIGVSLFGRAFRTVWKGQDWIKYINIQFGCKISDVKVIETCLWALKYIDKTIR